MILAFEIKNFIHFSYAHAIIERNILLKPLGPSQNIENMKFQACKVWLSLKPILNRLSSREIDCIFANLKFECLAKFISSHTQASGNKHAKTKI